MLDPVPAEEFAVIAHLALLKAVFAAFVFMPPPCRLTGWRYAPIRPT